MTARATLPLLVLLLAGGADAAASGEGAAARASLAQPGVAPYAPGELIVKFKAEGAHALGGCAEALASAGQPFEAATADGSDSLDQIHRGLGVRRIRALFRRADGRPFALQRRELRGRFEAARRRPPGRGPGRAARSAVLPDLAHVYLVRFSEQVSVAEALVLYHDDPHVDYAQPNYLAEAAFARDDPFFSSSGSWGQPYGDLWGLGQIRVEGAWDVSLGEGVVVGVVDSGLDADHPDIADNLWINAPEDLNRNGKLDPNDLNGIDDDGNGFIDDVRGFDFHNSLDADDDGRFDGPDDVSDPDPFDDYGHGTHVAGTIAAVGGNGLGVVGVAPRAQILAAKGLGESGSGRVSNLAAGIVYAAANGAGVINNSWSCASRCPSNPVAEDAVRLAHALGAVLVFSAGNRSDDVSFYSPQNMRETLAVAAGNPDDAPAPFSNSGLLVDVIAPGAGFAAPPPTLAPLFAILSLRSSGASPSFDADGALVVGDDYVRLAGTSMSAPHVAGLAALIRARQPDLGPDDVRNVIRLTADDVSLAGHDAATGAGRIHAARALALDPAPLLRSAIAVPAQRESLTQSQGALDVVGTAAGPDFVAYDLSVGVGADPEQFEPLGEPRTTTVEDGVLGVWDVSDLDDGSYALRLRVRTRQGLELSEFAEVVVERNRPRPVSPAGVRATAPAVSGDLVAWHSLAGASGTDLFVRDLSRRLQRRLVDAPGDQEPAGLSGNAVVWKDGRSFPETPFEIFACVFDLESGACPEIPVSVGSELARDEPALSGLRVVWPEVRDGISRLLICQLDPARASCTSRELTERVGFQFEPAIDGRRIAWVGSRDGQLGIFTCELDVETGACPDMRVASAGALAFEPAVSGDLLAWVELNLDLRMCDLEAETGACPAVTVASPGDFATPVLAGRRVVWQEPTPDGEIDVFFCEYDRVSRRCPRQRLTTHPAAQQRPAIDGNRVVWEDLRNGASQVFGFDLPSLDPIGAHSVRAGRMLRIAVRGRDPVGGAIRLRAELPDGEPVDVLGARFVDFGNGRGQLLWRPALGQAGRYELRFSGTSVGLLETAETIRIEVLDAKRPPAVRGPRPGHPAPSTGPQSRAEVLP